MKRIRLIAGLLSLLLMICPLSACGGGSSSGASSAKRETGSSKVSSIEESDGQSTADDSAPSGSGADSAAPSGSGTSAAASTASSGGAAGQKTFGSNPFANIPASVKAKTVEMLTTVAITQDHTNTLNAFKSLTGITVKMTLVPFSTYAEQLSTRIAADNAPDLVNSERLAYPNGIISQCVPLNASTFKLDDPFWDKATMKYGYFRNNYYVLNAKDEFAYDTRVIMYNADLFSRLGITDTPKKLWEANKWDIDALMDLCDDVWSKGKGAYSSIATFMFSDFALASGQDFITYDGKAFASNLSSRSLLNIYSDTQTIRAAAYRSDYNANEFVAGRIAMHINTLFNATNKESFAGSCNFKVEIAPIPGMDGVKYAGGNYRGYAVPKGAKSSDAAAYWLRYMLQEDVNPTVKQILNADIKAAAKKILALPKYYNLTEGVANYAATNNYGTILDKVLKTNAGQMAATFDGIKNIINTSITQVNRNVLKVSK